MNPIQVSDRTRTFGLASIMWAVLFAAVPLAISRKSPQAGVFVFLMLLGGFWSVYLANRWRRNQGRRRLSMGESAIEFFWVSISSIVWISGGALALIFPAMCLSGVHTADAPVPTLVGLLGGLAGLTLCVYRGAIWGCEQ